MIRLLYENLADSNSAALTAFTEADGWPVENVRHSYKWRAWRSTAVGDQWLKFDLGSARAVNCVALVGHNFIPEGTIHFQGNATDDWTGPAVDETVAFDERIMIRFFAPVSLRWWRLLMTGGTKEGYYSVGRLFLGTYYEPGRGFAVNWTQSVGDEMKDSFSVDGQRYVDERKRTTGFGIKVNMAKSEKYGDFDAFIRSVGVRKSLFAALDPDRDLNGLSLYGKIATVGQFSDRPNGRTEIGLTLEEDA